MKIDAKKIQTKYFLEAFFLGFFLFLSSKCIKYHSSSVQNLIAMITFQLIFMFIYAFFLHTQCVVHIRILCILYTKTDNISWMFDIQTKSTRLEMIRIHGSHLTLAYICAIYSTNTETVILEVDTLFLSIPDVFFAHLQLSVNMKTKTVRFNKFRKRVETKKLVSPVPFLIRLLF